MIGTTAALLTAAAMSAGTQAVGGVMKSKASKAAAQDQARAAQQAQDYYRQGLGQLGQMYSPYINAGSGAMNTLGRLTTPGPGARYASLGPPNVTPMMPQGGGYAVPRGGMPFTQMYQGPYPQAAGGDYLVTEPTVFIAGEAGPERATFTPKSTPTGTLAQGLPGRAGALTGAMRGGTSAAGANALRMPFAQLY
jgi:hypothetical protein